MHNLDTTNGTVSYVDSRSDAWHQLGTQLDGAFTAEQAMELGHLGGWDVRKVPMLTGIPEEGSPSDAGVTVPGQYAVLRNNPVVAGQRDVLGVVGENYKVIQNEEHAALLNALVDESGAHFETAGAIAGGRRVFLTMKLPGHLRVGGVDAVENYIVAVNSHDGYSSFQFMVTPIRVVCQNTLNLAFSDHVNSFKVRHTANAGQAIINQAREALDITFDYLDGFQAEAERLINTTMTQRTFEALIHREFGPGSDAAPSTVTRTENKLEQMAKLFADAHTQEGIRDTAWAGLNAITEWYDHFAPTRGTALERETARATNAIFQPKLKERALKVIREQVGV